MNGLLRFLNAFITSINALPSSPALEVNKSLVRDVALGDVRQYSSRISSRTHLHTAPLDNFAFQPLQGDRFRQEIVAAGCQGVDSILVER
jgi:hypothetical protein